jgi:DNA-directed RNA polymerase subunit alpha
VQHEHQTIPGVVEDVHQVIQNLKRLVIVLDEGVADARLELSVVKAGSIRASAIGQVSGVTIVNPEQLLFTLQDDLPENRPLNVDLWVDRGRGFVPADAHEKPEDAPVDLIRVDSIYNPVSKANFLVEETRVGQRTDFDRLTIQVETNGAIDPGDAVSFAAVIARRHLEFFLEFGAGEDALAAPRDGGSGRRPLPGEMQKLLESTLDAFEGISIRSRNNLDKADIRTMFDLVTHSRDEVLNVPSFGEKSLEEVAEVLAQHGLRFGMPLERDDQGRVWAIQDGAGVEEEDSDEA